MPGSFLSVYYSTTTDGTLHRRVYWRILPGSQIGLRLTATPASAPNSASSVVNTQDKGVTGVAGGEHELAEAGHAEIEDTGAGDEAGTGTGAGEDGPDTDGGIDVEDAGDAVDSADPEPDASPAEPAPDAGAATMHSGAAPPHLLPVSDSCTGSATAVGPSLLGEMALGGLQAHVPTSPGSCAPGVGASTAAASPTVPAAPASVATTTKSSSRRPKVPGPVSPADRDDLVLVSSTIIHHMSRTRNYYIIAKPSKCGPTKLRRCPHEVCSGRCRSVGWLGMLCQVQTLLGLLPACAHGCPGWPAFPGALFIF